MNQSIADKIIELIKARLDYEVILHTDTNLEEIGINSMSFIKIVVDIEDTFDLEFDDEELNSNEFMTVEDISEYVEKKIMQ